MKIQGPLHAARDKVKKQGFKAKTIEQTTPHNRQFNYEAKRGGKCAEDGGGVGWWRGPGRRNSWRLCAKDVSARKHRGLERGSLTGIWFGRAKAGGRQVGDVVATRVDGGESKVRARRGSEGETWRALALLQAGWPHPCRQAVRTVAEPAEPKVFSEM